MILRVSLGILLLTAFAGPGRATPPPEQIAVDCSMPVYAIDGLICADPQRMRDEQAMRDLLAAVVPEDFDGEWIETQPDWIKRRALCAFRTDAGSCVDAALSKRLVVLRALLSVPPPTVIAEWRWSGAAWRQPVSVERQGDSVIVRDASGKLYTIAFAKQPSEWQPFVTVDRHSARQIRLRSAASTVNCKK